MSVFNPQQFLGSTVDPQGEKFSTSRILPPENDYEALVDSVSAEEVTSNKDPQVKWQQVNVQWELQDESGKLKAITHRDKNLVRQRIRLDLTPEGALDRSPGMNDALGRFLEALDMNGKKFSWGGLKGLPAMVMVKHSSTDPENSYANVTKCWSKKAGQQQA